ncbi:MAG: phage scaffolding protein [Clostridiales bacterium]|nr:phage scaffolding protein [Clostridiales bacterium]
MLKDVLGEELFALVKEALRGKGREGRDLELAVINNGSYLPAEKFNQVNEENKSLKNRLKEQEAALSRLPDEERSRRELSQQLEEERGRLALLQQEWREAAQEREQRHGLELALLSRKARNTKACLALLDREKASGESLEQELDRLAEEHPYLFEEGKTGLPRFAAQVDPPADEGEGLARQIAQGMGIK